VALTTLSLWRPVELVGSLKTNPKI